MIVALSLLLAAVTVAWLVPGRLAALNLRRRDPLMVIVWWLLSMLGVVLAAVTGVVLLLLPSHGEVGVLLAAMHHCWSSIQHGSAPATEEFGGIVGATLLLALALRVVIVARRGILRRSRLRREHLAALRLAARSDGDVPATLWLAHERPLAFSMGGKRGVIVATEGLNRHLGRDGVDAVLAHERAHLTGRHHHLIALADALRAAFPLLPLFRQAPDALRELVEIAADVSATREYGVPAVRSALLGVSGRGAPSSALAMARDAVQLRLARLDEAGTPPSGLRRAVSCGTAGLTAVALPFVVGTVFMLVTAIITCL
jgi:Zn-dependent protease with chaperone function